MRKKGDYRGAKKLRKLYSKLPSQDYEDPDYRRLKYARYADDTLLGYIGTRKEAEEIKQKVGKFLNERLK